MEDLELLANSINENKYEQSNLILILAAGFEERNIAALKLFENSKLYFTNSIIFDYPNPSFNEPIRSEIISSIIKNSKEHILFEYKPEQINELDKIIDLKNKQILIDVSGMTRILIFEILKYLDDRFISYDILYTEAEEYFPQKSFYENLINGSNNSEEIFSRYLKEEKAEIVYSYDCKIAKTQTFSGYPEPGKPAMLIAFLTFKRSRLQVILQNFEFENKVLFLSEPVREDLKWRKEYLVTANYDLIQKNQPNIKCVKTLYPSEVEKELDAVSLEGDEYTKFNIMLAPLGSKMQTVGCYLYWKKHPEISIIFSQPQTYFTDSYSKSYRDTFVLPHRCLFKSY